MTDDSADVWATRLAAIYERMRAEDPSRPTVRFESLEAYLERVKELEVRHAMAHVVDHPGSLVDLPPPRDARCTQPELELP